MFLSDVCLSRTFGPNSRTERPRKTKISTEVAHVTCDWDTTFEVKRSKVATICPAPVTLTYDLLTLKMVSVPRVTCATSVLILVFLDLSVLDLEPIYATDRQTDRCQTDRRQTASSLNVPA